MKKSRLNSKELPCPFCYEGAAEIIPKLNILRHVQQFNVHPISIDKHLKIRVISGITKASEKKIWYTIKCETCKYEENFWGKTEEEIIRNVHEIIQLYDFDIEEYVTGAPPQTSETPLSEKKIEELLPEIRTR